MGAIETSLAALKEASSLAGKIPFIAPVAGLLLLALTMRDEVKQNKEEWDVVMSKLETIAGLVDKVGTLCEEHNLEEKDIPPGLRAIFECLVIDLDGIERALKENNEVGGIKKLFLRKDLLRKVKQYDGKLTTVLNTFNAQLGLDMRFTQLAEGLKVTHGGLPGPSNTADVIKSMHRKPRLPQIFFGRDSELAEIIQMIFTNLGSRPARIAILGPGGYGKSTLASAVLAHERVQEHFRDARYFVACESIFSSGALLIELAKALGIFDGDTDATWSRISTMLDSKDCIICLDNFESPWEDADTRNSVEELLSRVTGTRCTLLITLRGTVRPAQTQWTMPFLPPLMTLHSDAARQVWEHTTGHYDEFAEELIKAVDYVPLAVSLLAHLAQATSPQILLEQWNSRTTEFIHTGQANRQSNLDYSIQLSIDSGRMRANPSAKELLGVLSMLPDGMHIKQLKRFKTVLSKIDILSGICTLLECGIISVIGERYQTHPIIRDFCKNHNILSQKHKNALTDFYISIACINFYDAQANSYNEMVLEVNNTKAMLFNLLKSDFKDYSKLVRTIYLFVKFQCSIGDFLDQLISQAVEHLKLINASTSLIITCLYIWGRIHYDAENIENAKIKLQEAEMLCKTTKENVSSEYADILTFYGEIYIAQDAFNDAKISLENALKLHKHVDNIYGQAADYKGLGKAYTHLNDLNKAKASFQKALELNTLANNPFGQGSSFIGLGVIYLESNELDKAKDSFQKALEFYKLCNDITGQGYALQNLGKVHIERVQLQDAKISFENALAMYKQAKDAKGQKAAQDWLNEVLSEMSQSGGS